MLFLVFLACDSPVVCSIDASAQGLAGPGATDCGSVGIGADPTKVDACVISSFEKHTPFYAVYAQQGIDSQVAMAFVSDGASVWTLSYDSDPSGGSDVGAVIYQSTCLEPTVQKDKDGNEALSCTASTSTKTCDESKG
jgi:hypothetical protein